MPFKKIEYNEKFLSERNKAVIKRINEFTEEMTSGPDSQEKCRAYIEKIMKMVGPTDE